MPRPSLLRSLLLGIGDMSADSVAASATRTFVGTRDFRAFGVERVFHGHAGHRLRIGRAKASKRSSWRSRGLVGSYTMPWFWPPGSQIAQFAAAGNAVPELGPLESRTSWRRPLSLHLARMMAVLVVPPPLGAQRSRARDCTMLVRHADIPGHVYVGMETESDVVIVEAAKPLRFRPSKGTDNGEKKG